jgi:hypothetical protein
MNALLVALVGLVGVIIGGFIEAYASSRASVRTAGRAAARLAADGLGQWIHAIEILKERAPSYPRDSTHNIHLALVLRGIHDSLGIEWWESNRAGLVGVAADSEWVELTAAAKSCDGILAGLATIGDVGMEVSDKRAEAQYDPTETQPSNAPAREASSGISNPEIARRVAETRQQMEQLRASVREGIREARLLHASIDYRLDLAPGVQQSFFSEGAKFEAAMRACRRIEIRNRHPLGLMDALRRHLARGQTG